MTFGEKSFLVKQSIFYLLQAKYIMQEIEQRIFFGWLLRMWHKKEESKENKGFIH